MKHLCACCGEPLTVRRASKLSESDEGFKFFWVEECATCRKQREKDVKYLLRRMKRNANRIAEDFDYYMIETYKPQEEVAQ